MFQLNFGTQFCIKGIALNLIMSHLLNFLHLFRRSDSCHGEELVDVGGGVGESRVELRGGGLRVEKNELGS